MARITKLRLLGVVCLSIAALSIAGHSPSAFGQCSPDNPDIRCYDLGNVKAVTNNDAGQVVGESDTATGETHAAMWTQSGGMVDLGTLGGVYSSAYLINNAGQVVGRSKTATLESHPFFWTQSGGMVDLGTLGGAESWAFYFNDVGQIAGYSFTATLGEYHAFFWTKSSGMRDLGTLGGPNSMPNDMNNAGQVVGYSEATTGGTREPRAFLWTQAGGMVNLGTLGGAWSDALQINDAGQVVGSSETATGESHAFFWTQAGGMVDLGTLGGTYSKPLQINNAGQVIGRSYGGGTGAFFWTQGDGMMDLGSLGGSLSGAGQINEAGQVVGWSKIATGQEHGFFWTQASGMVDLGTLGGPFTDAYYINSAGQVVGSSWTTSTGDSHAFLWTQTGGMLDLGTLGGDYSGAYLINNAGQILGWSRTATGETHSVVWDLPPFLDKSTLYFNATSDGNFVTSPQTVRVDGRSGTWTVTADQPWLYVSPAGGAGNGRFTVWVDPASMPLTSWKGTVTVSWSGSLDNNKIVQVYGSIFPAGQSRRPFGVFDTPLNGATGITGEIPVTGWALDDIEVAGVEIWRNPVSGEGSHPVYVGDAIFVEGARTDVEQAFPAYPLNYRAGWGFMVLTNYLPNQGNGKYKLYAYASDVEGHQTLLGTKTITCNNANATNPFGTIDTPTQGGPASGMFRNWGWVLTPLPNTVPVDGSTIEVWVDGSPVASGVSVGLARPDIQALFPGYNNTDTAVHYFDLDTTVYENGVHNISWVAVDDAGHSSGIGSRFFRIEN